mgnify:CR=1 FL=1
MTLDNPSYLQIRNELSTNYKSERLAEYLGYKLDDIILSRNQLLDRAAEKMHEAICRRKAQEALRKLTEMEILVIERK